jgi:Zn-dependent protease/CBS domain-containing protein
VEASLRFGRIRGIEIGIHYTWLIAFALLAYSLAAGVFPVWYPDWTQGLYWSIGAISSLLLFASVLAHELGHSLVAQARGIRVVRIVLFIFGGVAQIADEPRRAFDEFVIAIAGPLVSFVIGILGLLSWPLVNPISEPAGAILHYLGYANLLLVAFNLIPAYPLDGGRVLRAILWGALGSIYRGTRIASRIGIGIGFLFIAVGIFLAFRAPLQGIWLVAIGWFLQNAAQQAYQQLLARRWFEGITVGRVMAPAPWAIEPDRTIDELVDALLRYNTRSFPVVEDGRLVGIVTITDVSHAPRDEWAIRQVRDLMTPWERLIVATPDTDLETVLEAMVERDIHQVPVVQGHTLIGWLTRNAVLHFLQLRRQLDNWEQLDRERSPLARP